MVIGTNFGLNDSLAYTEFQFDSFQALYSMNSAAFSTDDWPVFLLGKPLNNVAAVKVLEVQIPFSYYVINSKSNTFLLTESDGGGATTVTLPVGNYTSTTIVTALGAALTSASANTHTYTVTYSGLTQKLTVSSNSGGVTTFTLTFGTDVNDEGWTNPREWLGFNAYTNSSTLQTLIAPKVLQITGPNYAYVNSVAMGAMIKLFLPASYSTGGLLAADGPQISKIPITSQPGGITFWQDPDPQKWFDLGDWSSMQQVDMYVTLGDNPEPVTFNGGTFSVKMGILTNANQRKEFLGGGMQNDRVQARIGGVI